MADEIDLMKRRYKVIADYPESPYKIGDIIDVETWSDVLQLSEFPVIFKKLQWWEHRNADELPEYLKPNERGKLFLQGVYKVMWYSGDLQDHFRYGEEKGECGHLSWTLPATESEYLNYINTPTPIK